MTRPARMAFPAALLALSLRPGPAQEPLEAPLPPPVKAVWDLGKADRETTPTRERICINGLWRWQPAGGGRRPGPGREAGATSRSPAAGRASPTTCRRTARPSSPHPAWKELKLAGVGAAWYQREITIPARVGGPAHRAPGGVPELLPPSTSTARRRARCASPAARLDLTAACRPGATQVLSLLVVALPLKAVLLSYTDTASARETRGSVARRGLCGDVSLVGEPAGARIADVRSTPRCGRGRSPSTPRSRASRPEPATRSAPGSRREGRQVAEFTRPGLHVRPTWTRAAPRSPRGGSRTTSGTSTRRGTCSTSRSRSLDAEGKLVDAAFPVRFGFREFWIDGRDFYLNGSRIYLSAVPLDNAQVERRRRPATQGARESLQRLKSFGINFVYTHNYGCEPGSHLSFAEILRAADDVGMLVALSQPHFGQYDWKAADADRTNGYAAPRRVLRRVAAQNHPSVVVYAMSHNATGYGEDMNPDMIDGIARRRAQTVGAEQRQAGPAGRGDRQAARPEPHRLPPLLGQPGLDARRATSTPTSPRSRSCRDWFEHWATKGVKPVFTCEYGVPFTWDWTMYRGWYKGEREFGQRRCAVGVLPGRVERPVPRRPGLPDQRGGEGQPPLGGAAVPGRRGSGTAGTTPTRSARTVFDDRHAVHRPLPRPTTGGPSAPGASRRFRRGSTALLEAARRAWTGAAGNCRWTGRISSGRASARTTSDDRYERMDLAFERDRLDPDRRGAGAPAQQPAAAGLHRAASRAAFTSKDHNFLAGRDGREAAHRHQQLAADRRPATASGRLGLPRADRRDESRVTVATGEQERDPAALRAARRTSPRAVRALARRSEFNGGETQEDSFDIHVLPRPLRSRPPRRAGGSPCSTRRARPAGCSHALRVQCDAVGGGRRPGAVRRADRRQGGAGRWTARARTSPACATG